MDDDGLPLFYYSENKSFNCNGVCSNITMNNYSFGSKMLDPSGFQAAETLDGPVVLGNPGVEDYVDTANSIRESLGDNPDALAEFERQLLEDQEGFLKRTYIDNSYEDVWDYALEEMMRDDPKAYDSLKWSTRMGDLDGAVSDIENYLGDNFDINEAYDMSSLYSAIENKKIGQAQLGEFMRNVMKQMAENENVKLNTDDLERFSKMLNSPEFENMMDNVLEKIEENPEAFDRLKDIAQEAMSRPETMEMFREAVDRMFENADWDSVNRVMDIFNKLENKEQLLETLMEGTSRHMREMVKNGKIDEIKEMLTDPQLIETMMKAAQSFSQSFLEQAGEWAEQIPLEFAYIVALAATIATLIMLIKLKI
jgi:hypothetical protein